MTLYLLVMACLFLSAVSLMTWAGRRGEFHAQEAAKHRALELDHETGVKHDE